MPHKFKQPRDQQHRRGLPHVKEELEAEELDEDEGTAAIAEGPSVKQPEESYEVDSQTHSAMEPRYGRIETSPLPLQRALLSSVTGRRCGPSTPVPFWKMYDIPIQDSMEPSNPMTYPSGRGATSLGNGCSRVSVSARKLAASLWEMQGAPSHHQFKGKEQITSAGSDSHIASDHRHGIKERDHHREGKEGASQHVNGVASHHHHQHRHECSTESSKHHKLRKGTAKDAKWRSPVTPSNLQVEAETASASFVKTSPSMEGNSFRQDTEDGSTLSRELVKVLNQIWSLEEQHNVSTSMVDSLRSDLKKTKAQVQELKVEQSSYQEDMEMLTKKLADERTMLQNRAQEAISSAIKSFKEELESERKSKLKLESKHKKLSKDMADARKTLAKTVEDFEREQKARLLMEDVCDELAREIGEDKAQVEELKRQSAKYREEVEQEREMLQMAEVWREERVHMKLAEARLEMEEKNSALDKLRGELEAFLRAKRLHDEANNASVDNVASSYGGSAPAALHKQSSLEQRDMEMAALGGKALPSETGGRQAVGDLDDDDYSFDDDLHSIELNRRSVSSNYDNQNLVQGHQKDMVHSKTSGHSATQASLLRSPSANGVSSGKQEGSKKLSGNKVGSEVMAQRATNEIQVVDSSHRGHESGVKDWDLGERAVAWSHEGFSSVWQNDREKPRALSTTKIKGRSELDPMDSSFRNGLKGTNTGVTASVLNSQANRGTTSNLQVFDLSQDRNTAARNGDGGLSLLKQSATFPSSPTRQWAHSWSSPDPESSAKVREGLGDRPFKDNSLKAHLLEAKLEGQQERLRRQPGPLS